MMVSTWLARTGLPAVLPLLLRRMMCLLQCWLLHLPLLLLLRLFLLLAVIGA
jgi:hypothetical protein